MPYITGKGEASVASMVGTSYKHTADVVELVYTSDLKSDSVSYEGSSPSVGIGSFVSDLAVTGSATETGTWGASIA